MVRTLPLTASTFPKGNERQTVGESLGEHALQFDLFFKNQPTAKPTMKTMIHHARNASLHAI